jgi:hypothetical protein
MAAPLTWKNLLDACDALGISQRQLAGKMQARFPRKDRPEGQQGLSASSLTRYAMAGVVAAPLYVDWFLSLAPTVRGDKQAWAEFVARCNGPAVPAAEPRPVDPAESPDLAPAQPPPLAPVPRADAPDAGPLPQATPPPTPSRQRDLPGNGSDFARRPRAAPGLLVVLGAIGAAVMLGGFVAWFWHDEAARGRTAEELHQCQDMAARLARTVERAVVAVEKLTVRNGGRDDIDQLARGAGVSENSNIVGGSIDLGGKPRLTIPTQPFSWQSAPPCNQAADQEALGGGCWVWTGRTAPCSAETFENPATGKCYVPVVKKGAVPQSERPRSEER